MIESLHTIPRILLSGLSGGSGKTFISLGLSRAWSRQNNQIVPFKKGPDYIDATWLGLASSSPCYCLDPFFLEEKQLKEHFIHCFENTSHNTYDNTSENIFENNHSIAHKSKIAIIEGNRGLFDGKDVEGSCSSGRLANVLKCPVIVSINCTKMTRTVAAIVMGIKQFDPSLLLAGVILNNTGSERHANLVQKSVEMYTDTPVLGVLPRMKNNPIPERHMGLHLHQKDSQNELLDTIATFLGEHLDMERIYRIAHNTSPLANKFHIQSTVDLKEINTLPSEEIYPRNKENIKNIKNIINYLNVQQTEYIIKTLPPYTKNIIHDKPITNNKKALAPVNIAYIYDDALWFYYQENLDALKDAGANLIPLSILDETPFLEQANHIPFDALYIGGGFPELYAEEISKSKHLAEIKELIEKNMPVYAECGGFIILSKQLHIKQAEVKKTYTMANVFSIETEFFKKPQGLGYITAHTKIENPFHPLGSIWNGHEFHFSKAVSDTNNHAYALTLNPGYGMQKIKNLGADGLVYKQCFASYAHLFAPSVPHWAKRFIDVAIIYKKNKKK